MPNGEDQDNNAQTQAPLAHDGPVINGEDELDPAGAVTARTVEAGPSHVGEGTPEDEDSTASASGSRKRDTVCAGVCLVKDRLDGTSTDLNRTSIQMHSTNPFENVVDEESVTLL